MAEIHDLLPAVMHHPLSSLAAADLARGRGFWYEAEYRYGQALEEDPENGRARFYHGWALATLRRYGEAAPEYVRAAELGYDPAFAYYQAARSLARAGEFDGAFSALRQAVDAGFSDFERLYYEGALRSLHDDPRWSELLPPFEAKFADAFSLFKTDTAGALNRLNDLVSRYPEEGRAQYYAGLSAEKAGRYAEAAERLVASADRGFLTPHSLYHAARAMMGSGDSERAWTLLRGSLEAGFLNWALLENDEVFTPLHVDPRWERMLSGLGLGAAPPLDPARWSAARSPRAGDRARDLRVVDPESAGMDPAILDRGVQYLRASRPRTNSLIVVRHGRIVYEKYFNGYDVDAVTNVKSVSKAVVSAAVGAALDDGLIASLDQPVAQLLPEYFSEHRDPDKSRITLRHLLTMTSGLHFDEDGPEITAWLRSNDWLDSYLDQELVDEPGEVWEYATPSTHLLGAAIARAAGEPLGQYVDRRIFVPIGIASAEWSFDPQGNTFAGSDLYMTPRDMARFGLLYLDRGLWGESRVLPERWIVDSTAPQVADETDERDLQDYGFAWWHWTAGRYRSFLAAGHGGQFINVTPELDLIVVTTGDVHRPQTPPVSSFILKYVFGAVVGAED